MWSLVNNLTWSHHSHLLSPFHNPSYLSPWLVQASHDIRVTNNEQRQGEAVRKHAAGREKEPLGWQGTFKVQLACKGAKSPQHRVGPSRGYPEMTEKSDPQEAGLSAAAWSQLCARTLPGKPKGEFSGAPGISVELEGTSCLLASAVAAGSAAWGHSPLNRTSCL